MALTEDEKLQCAEILGVTYIDVNDKITNLGTSYITATVETRIRALTVLWDSGVGSKTTKIHKTESNRGVETNPEAARADIKRKLASLLYFTDLMNSGGITSRLMRG